MKSVLRSVGKRKRKTKRLERLAIVDRKRDEGFDVDTKIELIRALIPSRLMTVAALLDEEVMRLAGPKHERKPGQYAGMRHGRNPGSVRLGGQRIAISVPRVRGPAGEIPLPAYGRLHEGGEFDETLLKRVRYGISCRNYEAAARAIPGTLGLSGMARAEHHQRVPGEMVSLRRCTNTQSQRRRVGAIDNDHQAK